MTIQVTHIQLSTGEIVCLSCITASEIVSGVVDVYFDDHRAQLVCSRCRQTSLAKEQTNNRNDSQRHSLNDRRRFQSTPL